MKSKIFTIIIALMFAMPLYAAPEEGAVIEGEQAVVEEVADQEVVNEEPVAEEEPSVLDKELAETPYKHPISKRKIVKKFLLAMFGVAASSLIIFMGLSLYNRLRGYSTEVNIPASKKGDSSLETPDNLTDAIKTFLDKTRWE